MQRSSNHQSWEWVAGPDLCYCDDVPFKSAILGIPTVKGQSLFFGMDAVDQQMAMESLMDEYGEPRAFSNVIGHYVRKSDGVLFLLEMSGEPLFDDGYGLMGYKGVERVIANIALYSAGISTSIDLDTIYATAPIAMCVVDRDGVLISANEHHVQLSGRSLFDTSGAHISLLHPELEANIQSDFCNLDAGGRVSDHEVRIDNRDYAVSVTPVRNASGAITALSLAYFDITERKSLERKLKEANERLRHMSIHDHLTGAYNRRFFDAILRREAAVCNRRAGNLSVILIDIDFFKFYNDKYGHLAGDECLAQVARAMRDSLEDMGGELFRYGGEEFAVVLPECDDRNAHEVCETLRAAVCDLKTPHAGSDRNYVTISAGVATVQSRFEKVSPSQLAAKILEAADKALYEAKNSGRNRVKTSTV
ncbi:diguanylate cyclase [Desulfovibrio sp. QI0442]